MLLTIVVFDGPPMPIENQQYFNRKIVKKCWIACCTGLRKNQSNFVFYVNVSNEQTFDKFLFTVCSILSKLFHIYSHVIAFRRIFHCVGSNGKKSLNPKIIMIKLWACWSANSCVRWTFFLLLLTSSIEIV